MLDIGVMINETVKEFVISMNFNIMMEIGSMIIRMDMDYMSPTRAIAMKANGSMMKKMEKDMKLWQMELNIKVTS